MASFRDREKWLSPNSSAAVPEAASEYARRYCAAQQRLPPPFALCRGLPTNGLALQGGYGCGQNAADYNHGAGWSVLADRHGFALLFPEQQRFNNPQLAFNWFAPEDSRRNTGEARSIREMVEALVMAHGIDRRRIFITGLSAGGAMTSVMLATYPDVFAGGAIIAGLPYGGAATMSQALGRMRGRVAQSDDELEVLVRNASAHDSPWPIISIWHGSADYTVHASNAQAILAQRRALHDVKALPSRTDLVDGYPHQVWCSAGGRPLIEEYSITGMGHGTAH